MMNHEPDSDIYDEIYRRIVDRHKDEENNKSLIDRDFHTEVEALVSSGRITLGEKHVTRLNAKYHLRRIDTKYGRATRDVLEDFCNGQQTLELDAYMDMPMRVGPDRRTTVRHLRASDIWIMTEEQQKNAKKAHKRLESWKPTGHKLTTWLESYGDLASAVGAGVTPWTVGVRA